MSQDEQAIRKWYDDWIKSTKVGDLDLALSLVADDAIFLVPGAGQMDKQTFCEAMTATDPNSNTDYKIDCSIQEVRVLGDHAWLLATVSLEMKNRKTDKLSLMKGDSISILKRHGDSWLVVRDANTMVNVPSDQ